mmetsp:Transcript_9573/g.24818  ORF Transcript_9573/g.24818 Transcript_9573/m.24818 type:complete len:277 (-) Transcript_9573:773-1603(-)
MALSSKRTLRFFLLSSFLLSSFFDMPLLGSNGLNGSSSSAAVSLLSSAAFLSFPACIFSFNAACSVASLSFSSSAILVATLAARIFSTCRRCLLGRNEMIMLTFCSCASSSSFRPLYCASTWPSKSETFFPKRMMRCVLYSTCSNRSSVPSSAPGAAIRRRRRASPPAGGFDTLCGEFGSGEAVEFGSGEAWSSLEGLTGSSRSVLLGTLGSLSPPVGGVVSTCRESRFHAPTLLLRVPLLRPVGLSGDVLEMSVATLNVCAPARFGSLAPAWSTK